MAIEILDLPIKNCDFPHAFLGRRFLADNSNEGIATVWGGEDTTQDEPLYVFILLIYIYIHTCTHTSVCV